VRSIFKTAFTDAQLPPFTPHRFRDTLSAMGRELCSTTEEQMAWARNMGHENPSTTFITYGAFSPDQQFETIERFGNKASQSILPKDINIEAIAEAIAKRVMFTTEENA
jgi:integrase